MKDRHSRKKIKGFDQVAHRTMYFTVGQKLKLDQCLHMIPDVTCLMVGSITTLELVTELGKVGQQLSSTVTRPESINCREQGYRPIAVYCCGARGFLKASKLQWPIQPLLNTLQQTKNITHRFNWQTSKVNTCPTVWPCCRSFFEVVHTGDPIFITSAKAAYSFL